MTNEDFGRIDAVRRTQGPIGNHVIDEYVAGRLSRRAFIRRGTIAGLSLPAISALIAACGSDSTSSTTTAGGSTETTTGGNTETTTADTTPAAAGGTLIAAGGAPSSASATLDPVLVNDGAGLTLLSQVGQFLAISQADLSLSPSLATKWEPNADGSEWTFTLDPKATFSDGSPVTAADVVATMERLVKPDNKSNALSAFKTGKLSPGGTTAKDDQTVVFKLDGPMGNFPYIVSSDNYNSIILPASVTDTSKFAEDVIAGKIATSGPWTIKSFDATSGIVYVPNPNYWGSKLLLEGLEYKFFSDVGAQVAAFQSGDVDVLVKFEVSGGESLLDNPDVTVYELASANHRQIHMRTTEGPFAKKEIRQAMAHAIDRQAWVDGLFQGKASIANDTPFFDVFPSSGTRKDAAFDLEKAKSLVAAGGGGFDVTLYGINYFEGPDLAVLIKNAAKEIGINVDIQLRDDYYDVNWVRTYDPTVPGSDIGITDFGHRGVPDVYLNAPLRSFDKQPDSGGVWNAAEYSSAEYDAAVDTYSSSPDLQSQKAAAETIQGILQEDVPLLIPYNINYLAATSTKVKGVVPTAMGHLFTEKASKA
ncbi:MAG: ABC transporter substrate-binding protein [Ilumatobacteraceae bacterium]